MTGFGSPDGRFHSTLWTVVRQAASPADPQRRAALGELIERYWSPVYVYLRRRGHEVDAARDLTQSFFTALLEGRGVAGADPGQGRFRSYLLGALKHHVANQRRHAQAERRGGGRPPIPLDLAGVEADLTDVGSDAELAYRQRWARALLDRALARLAAGEGTPRQQQVLLRSLSPEQPSYAQIAADLGITTNDVTNDLHRARKRLKTVLLEEALEQCGSVSEAREELAELFAR